MSEIDQLKTEALAGITGADSLDALEAHRVNVLGKKGTLTIALKAVSSLPEDQRREAGQAVNAIKQGIIDAFTERQSVLEAAALEVRLEREIMDVTLSPRPAPGGTIHPISRTTEEMCLILGQMGFKLAEGPDVEDDFHNFTALNFPPDHPARGMHDTFFMDSETADGQKVMLRTHTSSVQNREMVKNGAPCRVITTGRVYRSEHDLTHTAMFHQLDCLAVDKDLTLGHLKHCLIELFRNYFEVPDLPLRLRPSFFPFTEPSLEVDIGCRRSRTGIEIGNFGDWLEMGGAGMVHPNVLKAGNIDPSVYQGFAFGLGVERLAMLKYGIPDLRTFFDGDNRWLSHYGFAPHDMPNALLRPLEQSPSLTKNSKDKKAA